MSLDIAFFFLCFFFIIVATAAVFVVVDVAVDVFFFSYFSTLFLLLFLLLMLLCLLSFSFVRTIFHFYRLYSAWRAIIYKIVTLEISNSSVPKMNAMKINRALCSSQRNERTNERIKKKLKRETYANEMNDIVCKFLIFTHPLFTSESV